MPAADIFAMAGQDNRAILAVSAGQATLALMPVSRWPTGKPPGHRAISSIAWPTSRGPASQPARTRETIQRAVIAVPAA